MEIRHVKIEYEAGLAAKKQLLSTEMDLLNIQKKIRNYKVLRKKEFVQKNKLKTLFKTLKPKLNLFENSLPEGVESKKIKRKKSRVIEKAETADIQDELNEIRDKLAQL
jgi:hypothetical protein